MCVCSQTHQSWVQSVLYAIVKLLIFSGDFGFKSWKVVKAQDENTQLP